MADHFHYPHDILDLLVETIPRLVKSKNEVILFFEGAGVDAADFRDARATLATPPQSINKFEIARDVLTRLNRRQYSGLAARREVIKRVTQFESFETCWDNERLKAKGLVARVREAVNTKDSFTRMKNERDSEREQIQARHREEQIQAAKKHNEIDNIKTGSSVYSARATIRKSAGSFSKVCSTICFEPMAYRSEKISFESPG